jgi:glycosyltransferase involved in cell wall biosynthesis
MNSVSVIMTYFNENVNQLKRAIESIQNQTYPFTEFVIVAGNPDNRFGIDFVSKLSTMDTRIIHILCDKRVRMTDCLNLAIQRSKSEFIALQEADDSSDIERISTQVEFLKENPNTDVCGTAINYINDCNNKLISVRYYPFNPINAFKRYSAIAHPTYLVRKDVFYKFGFYLEDDTFRNCPDYELFLRWLSQGVQFRNINSILFNYYQSETNGRNLNVLQTLKSVIKLKAIYRNKLRFSLVDNLFFYLENVLLFFPPKIVSILFYLWLKFK